MTVAGEEASTQLNLVEPTDELIAGRLEDRAGVLVCRCRARRNWRILVAGSSASVSAQLADIQDAVRRAWAASLQSLGKPRAIFPRTVLRCREVMPRIFPLCPKQRRRSLWDRGTCPQYL